MLRYLFQCSACRETLDRFQSFPLCSLCHDSLVSCPTLCRHCASPICPTQPNSECLRPWSDPSLIQSYCAQYLLIGRCYTTLKRWKIQRGPVFDRFILKSNEITSHYWNTLKGLQHVQAIVPIPQDFARSWKMRGSRAQQVAAWVSRETSLPVLPLLLAPDRIRNHKRQAELNFKERLENPIRFEWNPEFSKDRGAPSTVLLVDDFFTTGHTLRQAARVLNQHQVHQVHIFCLGLRPAMNRGSALTDSDRLGNWRNHLSV